MRVGKLALEGAHAGVKLAYLDWGNPEAEQVILCVHGLTRNARDFDTLAAALADRGARVLAVDVVGRGGSSWLADPSGYSVPIYAAQFSQFLQLLELPKVDWIGTSMGGFIGMALATGEDPGIRRLILNDIGPFVPRQALAQIQAYLGLDPVFADLAELEAHLRGIHAPFGPLTDTQWQQLARHSSRAAEDGLRLNYDPAIRIPFAEASGADIDLWALWDEVKVPAFLLRGEESALVSPDTAAEMQRRGPETKVANFAKVGHAPALMAPDQIQTVARWLGLGQP